MMYIRKSHKTFILSQFPQQHCYASQKKYTLAGFEPGYSVLQPDAMTTEPRRQGLLMSAYTKQVVRPNLGHRAQWETFVTVSYNRKTYIFLIISQDHD
jgi:hypothetical protein